MNHSIGIYSGTFDPIHAGHIAFAQEALRTCQLDRVVFMPEPTPRNKNLVTDIDHRVALINTAIGNDRRFSVLEPVSDQFNVKSTLPSLQTMFSDDALTLLIGSDVLKGSFREWNNLDVLLGTVSLAIGLRNNDTTNEVVDILAQLEKIYSITISYQVIRTASGHVASSKLRNNSSDTPHLNSGVSNYIQEHDLYTT